MFPSIAQHAFSLSQYHLQPEDFVLCVLDSAHAEVVLESARLVNKRFLGREVTVERIGECDFHGHQQQNTIKPTQKFPLLSDQHSCFDDRPSTHKGSYVVGIRPIISEENSQTAPHRICNRSSLGWVC
jgi:hypothetical protein